jgi:hypothetical protein
MINHKQFRQFVIQPALKAIDLYSENAEELLIMTCAQETQGASFLKQISGPALGPYGCEPPTYKDVCMSKLYHPVVRVAIHAGSPDGYTYVPTGEIRLSDLGEKVNNEMGWDYEDQIPDILNLTTNLAYATMICRIHYLRVVDPIPDKNDLKGLFNYYKKYYNTYKGKATEEEVMDNYHAFLRGR